jgi:transcriptional regulator with XRE-family HTH domain
MARSRPAQSLESRELARRIRELRQAGVSVREIERRTGISRSQVSNIEIGKRRASQRAAAAALERLGSGEFSQRYALVAGEWQWVSPPHARDYSKWGRYERLLGEARRTGDYRLVRRTLSKSQRTIKVTGEGGEPRTIQLEVNPDILRQLDDQGQLQPSVIKVGPSPQAGQELAA